MVHADAGGSSAGMYRPCPPMISIADHMGSSQAGGERGGGQGLEGAIPSPLTSYASDELVRI